LTEYKLEIKQIVEYPRCRINRQLVHSLIDDRNIRTCGGSGLFYYIVLCCFTKTGTSYRRVEGINYRINPGECFCTLEELISMFRVRNMREAIFILSLLQKRHLISFSILANGRCVKYRIKGWHWVNRTFEYIAPCRNDTNSFFVPISIANEIIGSTKMSEADILIDLWINGVYRNEKIRGSMVNPIVYMRNASNNPSISCEALARRWNMPKTTVIKYLKKLSKLKYISITTTPGAKGMIIHLQRQLATMFCISDSLLDKEEIPMVLKLKLELVDDIMYGDFSVSKKYTYEVIKKLEKILTSQGILCFGCRNFGYKLLRLSDYKENTILSNDAPPQPKPRYRLIFYCGNEIRIAVFEINISPNIQCKGGKANDQKERSRCDR